MTLAYLARDIASRFHLRGAFVSPEHADIAADLREISSMNFEAEKLVFEQRKLEILSTYGFNDPPPQSKPFAFANGTAIIPIRGMLVNRLSWSSSYATGYNFIRSQLQSAVDDPEVDGIVFDVNSYGGMAAGCGELAAEIYAARDAKPSLAVIDPSSYSAGYYLASAADRVVVTPSGGVGSIGCVAMHVDLSGMLEQDGVKVTMIHAGKEKVDGNPFERLSPRARASIQRDVDYHYGMFTEAVARHREMPVEDVRATEAASFLPPEALEIGLIDAIETPTEAVANANMGSVKGVSSMTTKPASQQPEPVVNADGKNGANTEISMDDMMKAATKAAAKAAGEAVKAERVRSSGIRSCEEAQGREKLASHLADNTDMSVDEAKLILAASPKIESAAAGNGATAPNLLAGAMATTPNPNIKPDDDAGAAGAGEDTPAAKASRILGSWASLTGNRKVIEHNPARGADAA